MESVTYISDLNASYPASGDVKSEGDDHIRNLKTAVKATFPNVSGAVTPTHTELNYVDGVTSAIQTQLDAKAPKVSPALTGTATVTRAGTTYQAAFQLESGASNSGEFSPALEFSCSNSNAAIYSVRETANGGNLVFATQGTAGGNPAERVRVDKDGNLIPLLQSSAPTLATNGQMVINLTSNTNLRFSVRGSDGITRTANLTLS